MLIGSNISYEIKKNTNRSAVISVPNSTDRQYGINFGQQNQSTQETKESQYSFKNISNTAGVIIGISAIVIPAIIGFKKPTSVKLMKKTENLSTNINIAQDTAEETIKKLAPDYKKGNIFFRAGIAVDKIIENNEELINNLIYGFGTVVIMPLVILFSPIGKEKSSKEDKIFTILRQPLSFVTMFSMQLTVDKFFKGLVPKFIEKNLLEKPELLDEKGNIKRNADLEKVRFNSSAIKSDFDSTLKKVAGWSDNSIKQLFKFKDQAPVEYELKKLLKKQSKTDKKQIETLTNKLNNYFTAKNREKLLGQSLVITANILFSTPIGCTLLNVLYGKVMKEFKPKTPDTQQSERWGNQ